MPAEFEKILNYLIDRQQEAIADKFDKLWI
jgi:hypothetical protein